MAFLAVSHLSKAYKRIRAVEDFSFHVDKSETYALVGPDGAGKTTIIRTLCNLLNPDHGSAFLGELDMFKQFDRIKPQLGYMPQIFSLYPDLSVEENLIFYAGIFGITGQQYREKRNYLYTFSNLAPFSKRRAGDLSGGMKQKLALSCALLHDPELLLLDEPTTGVDPLSRRQFWEILQGLKRQGTTIVITTPYMDEVARADRAGFIFAGKKLAEGAPAQLINLFEGKVYYLDVTPSSELVRRINQTNLVRSRRFGSGMHLYTAATIDEDNFSNALKQLGIDLDRVTPVEPDLEDCFIQMMERMT